MEESITMRKKDVEKLFNAVNKDNFHKVWTAMSENQLIGENVDIDQLLKKNMVLIGTDLQHTFPELSFIRNNVIIKSFLLNHSQVFNPSEVYQSTTVLNFENEDKEECLVLFPEMNDEERKLYVEVINGCGTKRKNREKKETEKPSTAETCERGKTRDKSVTDEGEDNKYRKMYLNFLGACYTRSGN